MKHFTLSILALFIAAAPLRIVAQSTPPKFLIFGEPVDPSAVWGDDQWNLIRWENIGDSLRFNMGTLRLNVNAGNDAAHIRDHLGQAGAHNELRFSFLDPDREGRSLYRVPLRFGQRRLYHPECSWHYSQPEPALNAEDDLGKTEADASRDTSVVHASTADNPTPRIIVNGLAHAYGAQRFPTGGPMYMRARLKRDVAITPATLNDTLCVLRVVNRRSLIDPNVSDTLLGSATIFAREAQQSRYIHTQAAVGFAAADADTLDYQVY
ncbi:MAG: hypothetical protein IPP94_04565 [Ignavibacteria bacterium]|nr:hypothetical protein [Ignavibacteria bacterium]